MSNMSSFIIQNNCNTLSLSANSDERSCSCRNKDNCPLAGNCLKTCCLQNWCYQAKWITRILWRISWRVQVSVQQSHKFASESRLWKKTELSKHVWQLKRNRSEFNLKWSITVYATPYRCRTRRSNREIHNSTS